MIKKLFSGIKPTGKITIGNYINIIKKWSEYQNIYDCYYCIANLHSISNNDFLMKKNDEKRKNILDTLAIILSTGINPEKTNIFLQSEIQEHTYLFWILMCNVKLKKIININKIRKINEINLGTFNYSILMISDILLYNSDIVLVSKDQKKNIELCKNIIKLFNKEFNNIFNEIIFYINETIIKSLDNPNIKMSKSNKNKNSYITLIDNYDEILKKILLSYTDSDNPPIIKYDINNKSGISNLLNIVSKLNNIKIKEIENKMINKNYFYFKKYVAYSIFDNIKEIKYNFDIIRKKESYLLDIIEYGNNKVNKIAKDRIYFIKKKIGLT